MSSLKIYGLGQFASRARPLDPTIDVALAGAQAVLQNSDPNIPTTFGYVRRIIAAPPLFGTSAQKTGNAKISDLNPLLAKGAWIVENPIYAGLLILGIPVGAFLLGRASKRRR